MTDTLYIIGNGFDLHHGLRTSYANFRDDYVTKKGSVLWNDLLDIYGSAPQNDNLWWKDFENMLGKVIKLLASLMRRLKMCEELGRGWDRMVLACEAQFLPAPCIEVFQDSTKVTLFSEMEFSNIPMEDKLWSCYLHACLMYIQGDALTNKSLRDRFNVGETSAGSISRLIKEAVSQGRIKALDPDTAKRYMRYIPIWA